MKVIAISGVSGSGKTSVIKQLSKELSCSYLLFDDYINESINESSDENTYPKNMKAWFENGADKSSIKTPKFISSIRDLKQKNNEPFIFIEEPFGKNRDSISSLIDYVILLDTPMEICLSRVIMRNIKHPSNDSLISIPKYLSMYDGHFREIYIEATNQVRENCDLIIKEVVSTELTAQLITNWLKSKTELL